MRSHGELHRTPPCLAPFEKGCAVVSGFVPRLFNATDVDGASLVVSFDQDVEKIVGGRARHLRWDNLPAVSTDYALGRDEIVRHVDALIDELARGASP